MAARRAVSVLVALVGVVPLGRAVDDGGSVVVVVLIDGVVVESGSVGAVQRPPETGTPVARRETVDVEPVGGQTGAVAARVRAERFMKASSAYSAGTCSTSLAEEAP